MKSILKYHTKKYPKITTQDYVKLLYQNHFGPGHFIKDLDFVNNYYYKELQNINECYDTNLYEHIGNNFVRVNMHLFSRHFNNDILINAFYESSKLHLDNESLIDQFKMQLSLIPNDGFLNFYDYSNVHHSQIYNNLYHPHYRVITENFLSIDMKIFQIQNYIDSFKGFTIFALEGKCASGKTTLSSKLENVTIIDVDEFFLRKELKTEQRLNEIGGNIDYDLYEECLKKIKPNCTICYKIFDCQTQEYTTKEVVIKDKVLLVGVYSYHQKVRKYIDKLLYLIVDEKIQYERLKQRVMFNRFITEWVPLENKYFNSYDFIANADILI